MLPELKTTLYHGCISEIKKVDVSMGRLHKDFGKGFYMAVSVQQAIGMMEKKYAKETDRKIIDFTNGQKHLYEINLNRDVLAELNVKYFPIPDAEWADFVLMCRASDGVPHNYDMVIGPTADDNVNLSMDLYNRGAFGEKGSEMAFQVLIYRLKTVKLGIQYYIGKQNVADSVIESIKEIDWRRL